MRLIWSAVFVWRRINSIHSHHLNGEDVDPDMRLSLLFSKSMYPCD